MVPHGRRLGYEVTLGEPGTPLYDTLTAEIHSVTRDGADRVLVSFPTQVWHIEPDFAWSPDGDAVAYTTVEGVWRVSLGDGAPELVWRAPGGDLTQIQALDYDRPISLAWSRGGELAFTVRGFEPTEPDNPMSGGRETRTVVVIDPGSGRTLLEAPAAEAEGPGGELWSPDGQQLLVRARDDHRGFALVSVPVDGSSGEVRTPWTWALDWAGLDDVAWSAR